MDENGWLEDDPASFCGSRVGSSFGFFFQAKDHVRGAFMQEFPQWLETGWPQKSGQLEWSWSEWNKREIDWHLANAELNIAHIATRHPFLILFDLFSGRKSGSHSINRVMDSQLLHQVAR